MKFFLLEFFRGVSTFFCRLLALLGGVFLCAAAAAWAQSVSFAGGQASTVYTASGNLGGIAVDAAGDVFTTNFLNSVIELPAGGSSQVSVGGGWTYPYDTTLDPAGNLYVANYTGSAYELVEVPANGSGQFTAANFPQDVTPSALAIDSSRNIYVAGINGSNSPADEIFVGVIPAGQGSINTIISESYVGYYFGIALDSVGNLLIDDPGNNRVLERTPGGSLIQVSLPGYNGVEEGEITADSYGDWFVVNQNIGPILEIMPGAIFNKVGYGIGASEPSSSLLTGIGVDAQENLFLLNVVRNPYPEPLASSIVRVPLRSVDFGTVNVCASGASTPAPCSETQTLTYNVNEGGTLGTPVVLTLGSQNFDFTLGSGSTCTGAVTAGTTCTVNVVFTPRFTGARAGAVEVTDASGNVLATTYVHGYRAGPELAFNNPATQKLRAGGLNSPHGLAVDGAGDAFVADTDNVRVVKIPAGGGTPVAIGSGFITPAATAVDLAGNVYVADPGLTSIVEIPANGGAQTTVGSGLSGPNGVAVDRLGNIYVVVYVANSQTNSVIEIPGGTGSPITIASGLSEVGGLAVDGTGDVFVSEVVANAVLEYPYGGGTPTTLANDFSSPAGVATDGNGNVYVADTGNDRIVEIGPGGVQSIWGTGLNTPIGVAVDGGGSIFISDTLNDRVVDVERNVAPGLTFASTTVGATSSDSPRSVQVLNIGNATLTGTGLTVGANFVQVPGSGTPADCAANFSLAPGASCNLSISFQPTVAGSLTANAVLTDNSLNGRSPSQSVSLTGTGKAITTTTTATSSPNPSVSGKTVMLTATVKAASGAVPAGTIKFINGTTVFATATLNGGVATYNTSKLPAGSLALTAAYEGSSTDATSVSPVLTQVVLVPTVTTVTSSPNPSVSGKTVTLTATVTAASGPTPTGSVLFKNGTTTIGTGTLVNGVATRRTDALPSGTLSITAVYPVTGPDAGSTSGILTQVVNP